MNQAITTDPRVLMASNGKRHKFTAVWRPSHSEGELTVFRNMAVRSGELLAEHWDQVDVFEKDQMLSKTGAKDKAQKSAIQTIQSMKGLVDHLKSEQRKIDSRDAQLIGVALQPRSKDDIAGTLIDLELAKELKAMEIGQRMGLLSELGDPELQRVAVQMPIYLTGISKQDQTKVKEQVIARSNPEEHQALTELKEASKSASEAILTVYKTLGEGIPIAEKRSAAPQVAEFAEQVERQFEEEKRA